MGEKISNYDEIDFQLRADAEAQLAITPPGRNQTLLNKQLLLHELQVRRIELEMQNEQLQESMAKLADSNSQFTDLYEYAPVGYLSLNPQGVISKINLLGAAMFAEDRAHLIDRRFAVFVVEHDRNKWTQHFAQLLQSGVKNSIELTLALMNGSMFDVQLDTQLYHISATEVEVRMVIIDISERKRSELAMSIALELAQNAKKSAEEVNRIKSEFMATVRHELHTPLAVMSESLGWIREGKMGEISPQMQQVIDISIKNCKRLSTLLDDLLDLEKLQDGVIKLNLQPLPLAAFLDEVLQANMPYAAERKVQLLMGAVVPSCSLMADSQRLMQVMTNLLTNAVKFSPVNGTVEVTAVVRSESVRITVQDHGGGIPVEFREHIFHSFTQADAYNEGKTPGTGLGLAISRKLIEQMHGQIDFSSVLAQGTRFFIDVPLSH